MKENLVMKIFKSHLVEGTLEQGKDIGLRVDETLLQDATGTMDFLCLPNLLKNAAPS